jgi:SAM-dependent methyltransferase
MHPSSLPKVGQIQNGFRDFIPLMTSVADKDVLAIGFSEPEIEELIGRHQPRSITALTLWENHRDAEITRHKLVIGDITTRVPLDDDSFDCIVSFSVLEHVSDVPAAMRETFRLLRPGGDVCLAFGPVWSSAYGHHIYINAADRPLLNFSLWDMPAFMHLLSSPAEISDYYVKSGYSEQEAQSAIHYCFESDNINRVMFEDYLDIFRENFIIDKLVTMYNHVPAGILEILRRKYPRYRDFTSYGAICHLIPMQ